VAIAGCVGNLPNNMDIQYAQAAVLPLWFCIQQWNQSRSNPNTEMTLIVDVDINLLKELHEHGSVTMKDRRHDLYSLKQMK
jgi:hypothetical protein